MMVQTDSICSLIFRVRPVESIENKKQLTSSFDLEVGLRSDSEILYRGMGELDVSSWCNEIFLSEHSNEKGEGKLICISPKFATPMKRFSNGIFNENLHCSVTS